MRLSASAIAIGAWAVMAPGAAHCYEWSPPSGVQLTPKDIGNLATLYQINKPYYEAAVAGAARFSGSGRVATSRDQDIWIDTGFGMVECRSPSTPTDGIKPGDTVAVSGSVGGAATAASVHQMNKENALFALKLNPEWKPWKERDTLLLLPTLCQVMRGR